MHYDTGIRPATRVGAGRHSVQTLPILRVKPFDQVQDVRGDIVSQPFHFQQHGRNAACAPAFRRRRKAGTHNSTGTALPKTKRPFFRATTYILLAIYLT